MRVKDKTGQKFGRWTVIEFVGIHKSRYSLWKCKCDCGNVSILLSSKLTGGKSKSCGCLRNELSSKRKTIHGQSNKGKVTRAYMSWGSMITRCYNQNYHGYKNYGGRNIFVCDQWHNFTVFFRDMGNPSPNKTLERIDNNKGYFPENCKWATKTEQALNRRNNHWITINGERKTLSQWGRNSCIPLKTIFSRIKLGWDYEKAIFYPLRKHLIDFP